MATRLPQSTISYNTESFLKEKLDSLIKNHTLMSYMYICHKGEDGDKDHIHLRVEPNKTLDPMDLIEYFREYTPNNKKPLGVLPFRNSKEVDWILYAVHDEQYLKIKYGGFEKGEKLPYNWQDIVVPEYLEYEKEIRYTRAKISLEHTSANLAKKIQDGVDPLNLILQGENVNNVNAIYRAMMTNDYKRLHDDFNILQIKYKELESRYNVLYQFLVSSGYQVIIKDKKTFIEKES